MKPARFQLPKHMRFLQEWPEWQVVGILLGLAAIARFATIAKASIWHDEGFTMMLIGRNPAAIWAGSARDVHPPLYYELLHFWTNIFGRSELAARGMSAVAGLATIYVCYLLVKRIVSRQAATITLLVLALAPMLVRYSQEARMYGVLGLFLVIGSYALLRALEKTNTKKLLWWSIYAVSMAAGMYTHYFTVFAIIAHWFYVITLSNPHNWRFGKSAWLSKEWWLANIGIIVLWLPWLPSFYGQFSRGQGIGWIPKTTIYTLPNNIWQNITFTDGRQLPPAIYWLVPGLVLLALIWTTWNNHKRHPGIKLLFWFAVVPIMATILLSIVKPIYQDRYLVFAANGLYMLLGITLFDFIRKHHASGFAALISLCLVCVVGVVNVGRQASHTMAAVGQHVNSSYQPGDEIVSAELYTYFDFSYYCDKCYDTKNEQVWGDKGMIAIYPSPVSVLKLNTTNGRPNGYGESALLYDRADQIYVDDLKTIQPVTKRVWLVGKPGDKPYWKQVPANWQQVDQYETNSSAVRLYNVTSQ